METAHILPQPAEHQQRSVPGKLGRLASLALQRILSGFGDFLFRILPGIAEYEFARPQQILAGLALPGVERILARRQRTAVRKQASHAGLRNPVAKAEMLVSLQRTR